MTAPAPAATPPPPAAAIYRGAVMHARLLPFRHRFVYRVTPMMFDIDRLGEIAASHRLFSVERFNLFSFRNADHGPRDGSQLRPWVEDKLRAHGVAIPARIRLVCFPRALGHVFNPISIYFCDDAEGDLQAIVYEVKNTFGGQHAYVVPIEGAAAQAVMHARDKLFYVSPFIGMAARYRFRVKPPGARLSVMIREHTPDGELLVATMTGDRRAFTDAGLAAAFLRVPFHGLKVLASIYWEALRLWVKGARYHPVPAMERMVIDPKDARQHGETHRIGT